MRFAIMFYPTKHKINQYNIMNVRHLVNTDIQFSLKRCILNTLPYILVGSISNIKNIIFTNSRDHKQYP